MMTWAPGFWSAQGRARDSLVGRAWRTGFWSAQGRGAFLNSSTPQFLNFPPYLIGALLRLFNVRDFESTGLAGGFDAQVADAPHLLAERATDRDVLNLGQLDGLHGGAEDAGLVPQLAVFQFPAGALAFDVLADGPQQQQGRRGDGHEHAAVLRRRPPHERGNQQNRHCRISQVNESHCRTNFDCSHVSPSLSEVLVSRASRRVSTRHATVRSPRYGSFGTSPLRRKVGALGVF